MGLKSGSPLVNDVKLLQRCLLCLPCLNVFLYLHFSAVPIMIAVSHISKEYDYGL